MVNTYEKVRHSMICVTLVCSREMVNLSMDKCLGIYTDTINVSWDSLLVECWTHDQKVANSNPGRSGERVFFSRINFLC